MLTNKYRPQTQDDWVGQKDGLSKIARGVKSILEGGAKHRVILIYGPRGVGKNTAVEIVARQFNLHIIEINASDERKTADMIRICKTATTQNLFNDKNLILLDEADGLTKTMQKKLIPILSSATTPIILCVNNHSKICREVKSKSLKVELKAPSQAARIALIEKVAKAEGIVLSLEVVKEIANITTDYRNVLNVLELALLDNTTDGLVLDDFDKSFEQQLDDVFEDNPPDRFVTDPSTILHYMSENAMDASLIADADVMLQHVKDTDDYVFWRYAFGILEQCRQRRHHKIMFPFRTFRRY